MIRQIKGKAILSFIVASFFGSISPLQSMEMESKFNTNPIDAKLIILEQPASEKIRENDTYPDFFNVSESFSLTSLVNCINITVLEDYDLMSNAKHIIYVPACWIINGFMFVLEQGIEGARCTTLDHSPGLESTGHWDPPLKYNYGRIEATYHSDRRRQRNDPDFWHLPRLHLNEGCLLWKEPKDYRKK